MCCYNLPQGMVQHCNDDVTAKRWQFRPVRRNPSPNNPNNRTETILYIQYNLHYIPNTCTITYIIPHQLCVYDCFRQSNRSAFIIIITTMHQPQPQNRCRRMNFIQSCLRKPRETHMLSASICIHNTSCTIQFCSGKI